MPKTLKKRMRKQPYKVEKEESRKLMNKDENRNDQVPLDSSSRLEEATLEERPLEKLQRLLFTDNATAVIDSKKNSVAHKTQLETLQVVDAVADETASSSVAIEREKRHFERHVDDSDLNYERQRQVLDSLDCIDWYFSKYSDTNIKNETRNGPISLFRLGWKQKIAQKVVELQRQFHSHLQQSCSSSCFTTYQLLTLLCSYWMDGICELPDYHRQAKFLRPIYLAHIVNYVLRCRQRVMRNNRMIQSAETESTNMLLVSDNPNYKDQGFTRPRVLILLPMRNFAYQVVGTLLELLKDSKSIKNYPRFEREFEEPSSPSKDYNSDKPWDYQELFQGNTDDDFCLGIKIGVSVGLFSDYYKSDILVASPLGLKQWMEKEDLETTPKYAGADVLSSIEICIVEGADVMNMQNWDHLRSIFERMNQLPKRLHGADISRVTSRALEDKTRFYRQSIFLTSYIFHGLLSLWRMYCHNMEGKARYVCHYGRGGDTWHNYPQQLDKQDKKEKSGVVRRQTWERIPLKYYHTSSNHNNNNNSSSSNENNNKTSIQNSMIARREFFLEILSRYDASNHHFFHTPTLIFIPSYFDYVQIRNIFYEKQKAGEWTFGTFCEYSSEKHIAREKKALEQKSKQFFLMTERFYFYYRERLAGISTLIFYQLPGKSLYVFGRQTYTENNQKNITFKNMAYFMTNW
jgi:U3 small nucleolar RNA-associated protein 25